MLTALLQSRNQIKIRVPLVRPQQKKSSSNRGDFCWKPGDAWEDEFLGGVALDIIGEFQEGDFLPRTPLGGWGKIPRKTKFGRKSFESVMDASCHLDREVSEKLFVTLTIPGSGVKVAKEVAKWSGYIVNLLRQRFRDWKSKWSQELEVVHVWEWQKRGMLHLHLLVSTPSESLIAFIEENMKSVWTELIDGLSRKTGRDLWRKTLTYTHSQDKSVLQVNCQRVMKSVAGYLSKYLSKTTSKEVRKGWFCPSRWWGCSRSLRKKYLAASVLLMLPVFNQSWEDSLITLTESLSPYIIGSKKVVGKHSNTETIYLLIDREKYSEVAKELEEMSIVYPSSPLSGRSSGDGYSRFTALYGKVDHRSVEVEAFREIWLSHALPGHFERFWYKGSPGNRLNYAAALMLYLGLLKSPWPFRDVLKRAQTGTLYADVLEYFFRETNEGGAW